jgi:RNA polymerase sigma-70 factor (sigma-E family)
LREGLTRRGEQRFAELYWRHASEAVRLAFLLTGDQHAAEDIAQDAFVRLLGRFQERKSPDAFEAYLRRTIVNLSRDRFRKLRSERDYVAQKESSPSGQVMIAPQIEEREVIREALQTLPHRQRAALVLRFYLDLSEQQTADVLQCSLAAVKSLVTRATGALRQRMGGETR